MTRIFWFSVADLWMIACGAFCGWKFIKKHKNYVLGIEWLIVAYSGTNLLVYTFNPNPVLYHISFFLDAFSRALGFTVLVIMGLMMATHRYKPSVATDVWGFAIAAVVGLVLHFVPLGLFTPLFLLIMWTVLSCFLAYFAWRLWQAGERLHAWGIAAVIVTSQIIASIYDFYTIPGDDSEKTLFFIAALTVWGFCLFEIYHAYGALQRSAGKTVRAPESAESAH
ncbi:transporter [Amycolatopsis circi]|uniref:transporter n=1 Tax=Amycolatopsis circi TaxID=871959 RepID=UPI000E275B7A|nr:transporter [Amycolatopsis circi]